MHKDTDMGMITILIHRPYAAGTLDFDAQFGFDDELEKEIEKAADGRVWEDCWDFPLDDWEHNIVLYMETADPVPDARDVYDFLISSLRPGHNVLVEVFLSNDTLDLVDKLHSNSTSDLFWGSQWEPVGDAHVDTIGNIPVDPKYDEKYPPK